MRAGGLARRKLLRSFSLLFIAATTKEWVRMTSARSSTSSGFLLWFCNKAELEALPLADWPTVSKGGRKGLPLLSGTSGAVTSKGWVE